MTHLVFLGQRKQVAVNGLAAQGLRRQRRDELPGARGQHATHRRAALLEAADEVEALIGGDAAGDDQENAAAMQHGAQNPLWGSRKSTLYQV